MAVALAVDAAAVVVVAGEDEAVHKPRTFLPLQVLLRETPRSASRSTTLTAAMVAMDSTVKQDARS
jgi:hypothetical protein